MLNEFGLEIALKEAWKRTSPATLKIKFSFPKFKDRLNLQLEINIFRIVRELMNNIIRHSGPVQELSAWKLKNEDPYLVQDNGKGYSKENANSLKGMGLRSIRNRVSLWNGTFRINSKAGEETQVHIQIPFAE